MDDCIEFTWIPRTIVNDHADEPLTNCCQHVKNEIVIVTALRVNCFCEIRNKIGTHPLLYYRMSRYL